MYEAKSELLKETNSYIAQHGIENISQSPIVLFAEKIKESFPLAKLNSIEELKTLQILGVQRLDISYKFEKRLDIMSGDLALGLAIAEYTQDVQSDLTDELYTWINFLADKINEKSAALAHGLNNPVNSALLN